MLPNITKAAIVTQPEALEANPFVMPSDMEVFSMREQDKVNKQQAKELQKKLSIYEKNSVKRKNFKALLSEGQDDVDFYKSLKKKDVDVGLINNRNRDRNMGKENLQEFIAKKREMFLVQYALGVKREEMRKLEEIAQVNDLLN